MEHGNTTSLLQLLLFVNRALHKTSSSSVVRTSELELGGSCVHFSHGAWAIFSGFFGVRILLLPNDIVSSDGDNTQNFSDLKQNESS